MSKNAVRTIWIILIILSMPFGISRSALAENGALATSGPAAATTGISKLIDAYKRALDDSTQEIGLLNQKVLSQGEYIKQLEQRLDAAINRNEKECGPSLLHELSCGAVGASVGMFLIKGFGK